MQGGGGNPRICMANTDGIAAKVNLNPKAVSPTLIPIIPKPDPRVKGQELAVCTYLDFGFKSLWLKGFGLGALGFLTLGLGH